MSTLTTTGDPSQDVWHVPLAPGQRLAQDAVAVLNADLSSVHNTAARTESEGRAA